MTKFKTTLKALIDKAMVTYIDGMMLCNCETGFFDGQFDARIEISDNDPDFPDAVYVQLGQEVEIDENGVGTIQIQDIDADDDDLDVSLPTKDATIECHMYRPITEADLQPKAP